MTDLVEWLRAQLDEDERIALAATRNAWTVDSWTNDNGVEFLVIADHDVGAPAFALKSERDAAHIAEHDPARVLREVTAKRELLEEVERLLGDDDTDDTARWILAVLASVYSHRPGYFQFPVHLR